MTWEDEIFTQYKCPHCDTEDTVPATGNKDAEVLIVGEFPGVDEIKTSKPFSGNTGTILKKELRYLGLDINTCRVTNLWLHEPNNNEKCYNHGIEQVIKEAKGRKAILLLGSDVTEYFVGKPVLSICGIQVKSPYFSAPLVFACVNPAWVFKNNVGELRWALKKFVELLDKGE